MIFKKLIHVTAGYYKKFMLIFNIYVNTSVTNVYTVTNMTDVTTAATISTLIPVNTAQSVCYSLSAS